MTNAEEIVTLVKRLGWTPQMFCEYLFVQFGVNRPCELSESEILFLKEELSQKASKTLNFSIKP